LVSETHIQRQIEPIGLIDFDGRRFWQGKQGRYLFGTLYIMSHHSTPSTVTLLQMYMMLQV
jgi:hypothetical protein